MNLFCLFIWVVSINALIIPMTPIKEFNIDPLDEILDDEQWDILQVFTEGLNNQLYKDDINDFTLEARDLESTIEGLIKLLNSSGALWTVLDYAVDHKNVVDFLSNTTAGLISNAIESATSNNNSNSGSSMGSLLSGALEAINITALGSIVIDSGLIQSTMDGLLLDENFRPTLSKLIYDFVENHMNLITIIADELLKPANQNKKRDFAGSLTQLAGNLAGSVLNSNIFYTGLNDTLVALNDTGFIVYTIKKFLSTPEYVNITSELLSETLQKSNINILTLTSSLGSLVNITKIVEASLSDTQAITKLIGNLLSGEYSGASTYLKRYIPGFKAIIKDLEDMGLFTDLNNRLFPSSSSANSNSNKQAANTASVDTILDNGGGNHVVLNGLMLFQTMIFSLFFFI